ncbi:MAG: PKD domain-containing protein, partial [bacterium]
LNVLYLVMSSPSVSDNFNQSQFAIVSPFDNVAVTITPSVDTEGGHVAGQVFSVVLNQGDVYQVKAFNGKDLTGSVIQASLPIAVFAGNSCAQLPTGTQACDHIVEQIAPVNTWGSSFVTLPLQGRENGDTFRIQASQDQTLVNINGALVATLNFGDFFETILEQPAEIVATKPVTVMQFSNGDEWDPDVDGNGDPFMMLIPPTEQFMNSYTMSTLDEGFPLNFLSVTIPTASISSLLLDGQPVDGGLFNTIAGTNFSGAGIPITIGSHRIENTSGVPFGVYLYGFSDFDSYGYAGGLSLEFINQGSAPLIVRTDETIQLSESAQIENATLTIAATISDSEAPFTQSATLFYRKIGEQAFTQVAMTESTGNIWSAEIPGSNVLQPGLEYYLFATDGQLNSTDPSIDPANNAYSIAVLPNQPPVIVHSPVANASPGADVALTATMSDQTNSVSSARLLYRIKGGTPVYTVRNMTLTGNNTYRGTIPAVAVTLQGVEYYLQATDNFGISTLHGTLDNPHVIVTTTSALKAEFTGTPTSGIAPLTVSFADQSTGNISSRAWEFGDGETSTAINPSHTYQNPGTYTVKLTVSGSGGSDTETKTNYIIVTESELNPPTGLTASLAGGGVELMWQAPQQNGGGEIIFETEPNDSAHTADALDFGQIARGAIDPAGDYDVWVFKGSTGQRTVIDVDAEVNGSSLDAFIELFVNRDDDGDGFIDRVDANDDFSGFDSRLDVELPFTELYFIRIVEYSSVDTNTVELGGPDFFYDMALSDGSTSMAVHALGGQAALVRETGTKLLMSNLGESLQPMLRVIEDRPVVLPEKSNSNSRGSTAASLSGYNIYRAASPNVAPTQQNSIGNVSANTTTFTDMNAPSGTLYYIVTAVYDAGESGPSNEVDVVVSGVAAIRPVSPASVIGSADTEFDVFIELVNVSNLFGVSFDLNFDPALINAILETKEGFIGDDVVFLGQHDNNTGVASIGISRKSGQGGVSGTGNVARITFKVMQNINQDTDLTFTLSSITANDPNGTDIHLESETSVTTLLGGLIVWPGDTNNDGVVNQADVLPIGLHWQRTGPPRDNASAAWQGQLAQRWSPEAATYADANGDGVVNQGDVLPVGLHWGKTHSTQALSLAKANPPGTFSTAANLQFIINGEAKPGEDFLIDIHANKAANLFGLSFEFVFSPNTFIEINSVEKGDGNLLGNDILFFPNVDNAAGKVSVGLTRKSGQGGVDGSGLVARIMVHMSENARVTQDTTLLLLQNVSANDPDGNAITFEVSQGALVTDVANSGLKTIPKEFALFQNYPNPFNPTTEISYNLPEAAEVKLQIFDILGRNVRTLVSQQQPAGAYSVRWDAHDDNGLAVASGVYVYLIKTNSFVAQKKLLFLK